VLRAVNENKKRKKESILPTNSKIKVTIKEHQKRLTYLVTSWAAAVMILSPVALLPVNAICALLQKD